MLVRYSTLGLAHTIAGRLKVRFALMRMMLVAGNDLTGWIKDYGDDWRRCQLAGP